MLPLETILPVHTAQLFELFLSVGLASPRSPEVKGVTMPLQWTEMATTGSVLGTSCWVGSKVCN